MILAWLFTALASPAAAQSVASAALPGGVSLPYYVSAPAGTTALVIGVEGYHRDANTTFAAVAQAVAGENVAIAAPIFEVTDAQAPRCQTTGVPQAAPGDALWTCGSWATGRPATNAAVTSFQAMDALLAALHRDHPAVTRITIAGFSAGGQFVQHYIGFAHPPAGVAVRYVVADPSEFVYFDAFRPYPNADCPKIDRWRFGIQYLPADLGRSGAAARAAYAAADITYLEGAADTGTSAAASYKLLEKTCAAMAQGPFRLQRGQAYAAYDAAMLAHGAHRLIIIPGCAHSVACVFPKAATVLAPYPSSRPAP